MATPCHIKKQCPMKRPPGPERRPHQGRTGNTLVKNRLHGPLVCLSTLEIRKSNNAQTTWKKQRKKHAHVSDPHGPAAHVIALGHQSPLLLIPNVCAECSYAQRLSLYIYIHILYTYTSSSVLITAHTHTHICVNANPWKPRESA